MSPHIDVTAVFMQETVRLNSIPADQAWGYVALGAVLAGSAIAATWLISQALASAAGDETNPLLKDDGGCDGGSWHSGRDESPRAANVTVAAAPPALVAILIAIPSMVGSWCWPLLLVTAFGMSDGFASTDHREESHHVTFGADLVLYGSILWYVGTYTPSSKTTWPKAPFFLTLVGVILVLLDPIRHLLLDHGGVICEPEDLAMYADGDGNLSTVGEFCRWATIIGMALIASGVMWFVGIPGKLYNWATGATTA